MQIPKITTVGKEDIGFLLFTPDDYGTQKHPVIIFLHGIGERGNGKSDIQKVAANGIPRLIAAGANMKVGADSFVVLSPQLPTTEGIWSSRYVQAMIDYAKGNLQIDPNRIYLTGLSLGGGGCWVYAFESLANASQIAALAPVCGTDDGNDGNACASASASNLPIWAFHCNDDTTVGVGNMQHIVYYTLNKCNPAPSPAVKTTIYTSGGHSGAWNNAYDMGHPTFPVIDKGQALQSTMNLYEWFLTNVRNVAAPVVPTPTPVVKAIKSVTINYTDGSSETKP